MKPNILIVDDNKDYSASLRQLLELVGYETRIACSVEEALTLIDAIKFDLSLIDIRLTDENDEYDTSGFAVVKRAYEKKIPGIVITAHSSIDNVREALHSQAVDYVPKEKGPEEVLKALCRLQGLTLLHISDLHLKVTEDGDESYDQQRAYDAFLQDVLNQSDPVTYPFAGIIVSGDVSFQCQKESFTRARHFLDALAQTVKVPKEHIILAPGNHDINRKKAQGIQDSIQAIKDKDPSWLVKFHDFFEFSREFYGEPAFSVHKLYRPFIIDQRVAVVAFNSCIVEGDALQRCEHCFKELGKEHYPGWINRGQIIQAGKELSDQGWRGPRIGVFHHHVVPEDWKPIVTACRGEHLIDYHLTQQRLELTFSEQGFQILLHGHRHKLEMRQPAMLGSSMPLRFGSGAFWTTPDEGDETANYVLLQLSPLDGRSQAKVRRYVPGNDHRSGFWRADDSIQPDGVVSLPITVPRVSAN